MCKVLIVIGAKDSSALNEFCKASVTPMSRGNTDGVGYTAIKKDGNIFTERWLDNYEAFNKRVSKIDSQLFKLLSGFIEKKFNYSLQGKMKWDDVTSVMLHTRYATSSKGFNNTHPFVCNSNKTSIIHNGMIRNHEKFDKLNSTCDSEVILTEYMKRDIANNPDRITELSNDMEGYWAVGATSVMEDGRRVLDVFKNNAELSLTYVKKLQAYVLCTSEFTLKEILNDLKWEVGNIFKVNDNVHVRFDPISGNVISVKDYSQDLLAKNVYQSQHQSRGPVGIVGGTSHSNTSSTSNKKTPTVNCTTLFYEAESSFQPPEKDDKVTYMEKVSLIQKYEMMLDIDELKEFQDFPLDIQYQFAKENFVM